MRQATAGQPGTRDCQRLPLVEGISVSQASIKFKCHAHGTAKRLEYGFRNMMGVVAAQAVDMHGYLRMVDEALEELVQQVDIKIPDASSRVLGMIFKAGTSRKSMTTRDSASSSGT